MTLRLTSFPVWPLAALGLTLVPVLTLEARNPGTRLVGVDYLSVDRGGHEEYPAHQELLGAGVVVVEGLDLTEVEPGEYELICLPLPLVGGDGAPARVILRTRL